MKKYENTNAKVDEQETTIQWSRNDKVYHLYTSDNTVLTKISKYDCWKLQRVVYSKDGAPSGYFFTSEKLSGIGKL